MISYFLDLFRFTNSGYKMSVFNDNPDLEISLWQNSYMSCLIRVYRFVSVEILNVLFNPDFEITFSQKS